MNALNIPKTKTMLAFRLAIKNLLGTGLRTWLNVIVLSFTYVVIIFYNGLLQGWNLQARKDTMEWEIGQGELWHNRYDPYDAFTFQDAHGPEPMTIADKVTDSSLVPILITPATIFPGGRMLTIVLKGIPAAQSLLKLPTAGLSDTLDEVPVLIGKRMATSARLKKDDLVLVRWRDRNGTFDACNLRIVKIFDCNASTVDNGQVWIDLARLQRMTGLNKEASFFICGPKYQPAPLEGWNYKDPDFLLKDIDEIIQAKRASGSMLYGMILIIALIAIFDTQVLSIFRRQREIGTYIALGMTRWQVVGLFTIEGGANSILAALLAGVYGAPLLILLAKAGIPLPAATDSYGLSIGDRIFPVYGAGLVFGTLVFIILAATIVSFMPARKISKMNPTDALKGKIQ
jgi:putative ABC transport system permease protein